MPIIIFLLLALGLTACSSDRGIDPAVASRFEPWTDEVQEYRFRPGDELDVKLIYNPELSDRVVLGPDGTISLPLIGFVNAAGRSARELQAELRTRFSQELRQPDVSVVPRTFGSHRVFVGGEVDRPGVYDMTGQIGVLQAVLLAGGFKTTAAEDEIILIRRTSRHTPMMRQVNLAALLQKGQLDQDVPLQGYDIVYVPRSGIAEANLFVDQYIRQMLPIDPGISYSIN